MSKQRWIAFLEVTFVAALGLMAAGPASAGAVFRGGYDPAPYAGTIEIYVPNSCLGTGLVLVATCQTVGDPVSLLSVTTFNPNGPPSPPDSLQFVPALNTPNPAPIVYDLNFSSQGDLLGMDTNTFGIAYASTGSYFIDSNGYMIQMGSGISLASLLGFRPQTAPASPTVSLYQLNCGYQEDGFRITGQGAGPACDCSLALVGGQRATQEAFVRVPEPGSLALILGALVAGSFTLRRRQRPARLAA